MNVQNADSACQSTEGKTPKVDDDANTGFEGVVVVAEERTSTGGPRKDSYALAVAERSGESDRATYPQGTASDKKRGEAYGWLFPDEPGGRRGNGGNDSDASVAVLTPMSRNPAEK